MTLLSNYTKYIYHLSLFFLIVFELPYAKAHQQHVNFTENKGQWLNKVQFKADLDGGVLFIENNSFTYNFYNKTALHQNHINKKGKLQKVNGHAFNMNFLNANKGVTFQKFEKYKAHKNYFIGNKRAQWASNVNSWGKIVTTNLYNGIDMETEGIQNGIKYQFNVAANANYKQIELAFNGHEKLWIQKNELHIKTSVNELVDQAPVAWQIINRDTIFIPCNYVLNNNTISFELHKKYNPKYAIVIDPVLVFASYTGSTADNFGLTATYDNSGNLYAGGLIYDAGYPTTVGAYDETYNGIAQYGRTDIAISKFDSTGANLLYSTYLGGANNTEVVQSMVVNAQNQLCLYGSTSSNDFPVLANAYDTTFNGGTNFQATSNGTFFDNGTDIFVSKFSADGAQLLASTYFGGTANDGVNTTSTLAFNYGDFYRGEINVDNSDNLIIGSCTSSADFPVTANAMQITKGSLQDGCIFKMDSNLENLLYSSFIGGNKDDATYAIAISGMEVYATGGTLSTDLQTSVSCYHPSFLGGTADGFIAKISTLGAGTPLISYIGTADDDQCFFVQLDALNNVYLYGQTNSAAFPYIGGVYQNVNSGQFIVKLDSLLSNVVFSTTFGNGNGQPNISPSAFLVDDCEHIYISGWGGNILTGAQTFNMPLTSNAFQSTTDGFNFYLAVFERDMDSLIYATYFGGGTSREHVDGGTSRFDKKGIVYQAVCAGCGSNDDFPTTNGAWSNTNNSSNCNEGVFKFDFEIEIENADFVANPPNGCSPLTVSFTGNNQLDYLWDFGNNDTTSTDVNPTRTFTTNGVYPVKFITRNVLSCNLADTIIKYITVFGHDVNFSAGSTGCNTTVNFNDETDQNLSAITQWNWSFGDSSYATIPNPVHIYDAISTYQVNLTVTDANGCSSSLDTIITLGGAANAIPTYSNTCTKNKIEFSATPDSAYAYYWNFGNQGASSTLQQTNFVYSDTGSYNAYLVVYYDSTQNCKDTTYFNVDVNPAFKSIVGFNQDSCNNQVQFIESNDNLNNPTAQWQWIFGDGQTSTLQNPLHNFSSGSFNVLLIATSVNGCIDTVNTSIIIKSYDPYLINRDSLLCSVPTELLLNAAGGDFYIWQPPLLYINPFSQNQLVTINSDTTFNVAIGRINSEGDTCIKNYATDISVSLIAQTNFSLTVEKDTIFAGENTTIEIEGGNSNFNYIWTPSQGLDNANSDNVIATPLLTTEYSVTINDGGYCSTSEKVKIVVLKAECGEASIYVPNTFTPNNDGKNDKLLVRGNFISQLYFAVYNRWGEKVFESNDKNFGWDGYYLNNLADAGVFGWYLKATCKDGETTEMKGNVTLIR
jgi:gliding motility-associated-like protein